jgi:hypothetical protein
MGWFAWSGSLVIADLRIGAAILTTNIGLIGLVGQVWLAGGIPRVLWIEL